MARPPGLGVRVKLTISYAAFLMLAGVLLLAVVWAFLLRYVPPEAARTDEGFFPGRNDLIRAFLPAASGALVALLILAVVGGWFLAGRMLAPLRRITDATRLVARGSLSHRIELPGSQDEFRELADSFDTMLSRIEAQVAEQQRFAANASHELRTPLAITQTLLEVARSDPDGDVQALLERLQSVNTRAIQLTEALLLLSRADGRAFARERVDLSLVAEEAAETLLPLATEHGVTIETSGEIVSTIGSHALLLQLATNLVHNAIVHNLTVGGGAVWVSTSAASDAAVLTVESTGEPLSPALVSTLTEPFQRGAERTRGGHAGVGLGLAIVQSIVTAHEGSLVMTARPQGGLHVAVRLPLAPPEPAA